MQGETKRVVAALLFYIFFSLSGDTSVAANSSESLSALADLAEGSWDLIEKSNPFSTKVGDGGRAISVIKESSWMSIIDLVRGTEMQLNPLPKLLADFQGST